MQRRTTKFVCYSSLDSNKYSIRLPLMSEFEIRDLFWLFKYVMHILDVHDFVSFSITKPFHPPFPNYVILNPTTYKVIISSNEC